MKHVRKSIVSQRRRAMRQDVKKQIKDVQRRIAQKTHTSQVEASKPTHDPKEES